MPVVADDASSASPALGRPLRVAVVGAGPAGIYAAEALTRHGVRSALVPPRYRSGYFAHVFAGGYDAGYYSPYYTAYVKVELPTMDMVQRALPEGVLSPDGTANGFVYFESFDRDAQILTLTIDLVDAETNCPLGQAKIPFRTR